MNTETPKKAYNPFEQERSFRYTKEQVGRIIGPHSVAKEAQRVASENPGLYSELRIMALAYGLRGKDSKDEAAEYIAKLGKPDAQAPSGSDLDALTRFPEREFVKMVYQGRELVRGKRLTELAESSEPDDVLAYQQIRRASVLHKVTADQPKNAPATSKAAPQSTVKSVGSDNAPSTANLQAHDWHSGQ